MWKAENEGAREGEKEPGTVREKGSGESKDRGKKVGRNRQMAGAKKETTVVR